MAKKGLFSSIFFICFFSGCKICDINYDLGNKEKGFLDFSKRRENGYCCGLDFEVTTGSDLYKYSNDSLNERLWYQFQITGPKLPLVKLNSFSFTRKKDRDSIPYHIYFKSDNKILPTPIINLPFYIPQDLIGRPDIFLIIAECSESYFQTKTIYISYDIEVGDDQIVKKNIKYTRRWRIDCRPKW